MRLEASTREKFTTTQAQARNSPRGVTPMSLHQPRTSMLIPAGSFSLELERSTPLRRT